MVKKPPTYIIGIARNIQIIEECSLVRVTRKSRLMNFSQQIPLKGKRLIVSKTVVSANNQATVLVPIPTPS